MSRATRRGRSCGVTLVELIVFIVIVSISVMGVLTALDLANRSTTDPMIHKQALALAEAILEEVQLQPFTYCDPDDANAATATSALGCATTAEGIGAESGETRSGSSPFDNVSDYHNFCMGATCSTPSPITDLNGETLTGLSSYTVNVTVANQALDTIASSDALLITVTVTGPAGTTVKLHGYRVRYAPNALP